MIRAVKWSNAGTTLKTTTVEKYHYRQIRFLFLVLKAKMRNKDCWFFYCNWVVFYDNGQKNEGKKINFCVPNMVHKRLIANSLRCLRFHDHDGMDLFGYILVHLLQHEIHHPIFRLAGVPNLREIINFQEFFPAIGRVLINFENVHFIASIITNKNSQFYF